MSDLALLIRLQARIATFLAELSPARLVALAEGRVSLAVMDNGVASEPAVPAVAAEPKTAEGTTRPARASRAATAPPVDTELVVERLLACQTMEEGAEYLASLRLRADNVKQLARALKIPPASRMDETTKKILNLALGNRSKHAALRQG